MGGFISEDVPTRNNENGSSQGPASPGATSGTQNNSSSPVLPSNLILGQINGTLVPDSLNRIITLEYSSLLEPTVSDEFARLAAKYGLDTKIISTNHIWIEDATITFEDPNGNRIALILIPERGMRSKFYLATTTEMNNVRSVGNQGKALTYDVLDPLLNAGYQVKVAQEKVFVEGGNTLVTCSGKVIIGDDTLYINRQMAVQQQFYNDNQIQSTIFANQEKWTAAYRAKVTERLKQSNQWIEGQTDLDRVLAELELTKDAIARELQIEKENIVFTTQTWRPSTADPNWTEDWTDPFHIDMAYRPLFDNTVLVPDYQGTKTILDEFANGPLSEVDLDTVNRMNFTSDEQLLAREAQLEIVINELEDAGLHVIRVPGLSGGQSPLNLMNGIMGTTPNGQALFITNSTGIPELDKILATEFSTRIDPHIEQKPIIIEFIEHTLLNNDGGLDCVTIGQEPEIPMLPHV